MCVDRWEVHERRRLSGFVRRGHGDLRLGNVCLVGGTPTLFDCVESGEASVDDGVPVIRSLIELPALL